LIHLVHTCSGWLRRKNGNWQRAARIPRILQWLLAGLMLIIGLAIGILGAKLASVGGTFYFAMMGLVMVIAAVLIFRSRRGGIMLYAMAFIASIVWAISDAGWTYWPLFSRLFALGVLAFLAALVWPFLSRQPAKKAGVWPGRGARRGAGGQFRLDVQIPAAGQRQRSGAG
jgi:hypothetical protein